MTTTTNTTAEYLIVAGGGGGVMRHGGGGGAGGLKAGVTSLGIGVRSVTVGAGGAGGRTLRMIYSKQVPQVPIRNSAGSRLSVVVAVALTTTRETAMVVVAVVLRA